MLKHFMRISSIACTIAMLALLLASPAAFASSRVVDRPQLPCTAQTDNYAYGSAQKGDIPGPGGAHLEISDYFEAQWCQDAIEHYQFHGYANGYIYTENAKLTLGTQLTINGLNVSFSLPAGASFSGNGGSVATHTVTANGSYVIFNYSGVNASSFNSFGETQEDTLTANIDNGDYQTQSQINLPPN